MATRSSWKGCLQLSLVCVPVKAYSTASSGGGDIHLNQLHADCHRRIQYKKTCPLHGEVTNDQIVSGYEYAQDHYVVVDPDELDRLRTEADKAIKIDVFIASDAFDPLYGTGKRYYLAPDGPGGQKAYALLYQAMVEENRYALAQVVLHGPRAVGLAKAPGKLADPRGPPLPAPGHPAGGSCPESSQDRGGAGRAADGQDPSQRFHG
jgi:DNA end-binding protein Ku